MRPGLRANLKAGLLTGLLGVAGFVVAHAVLITPIAVNSTVPYPWRPLALLVGPLPLALPVGALGGLAAGWAHDEMTTRETRKPVSKRMPSATIMGLSGGLAILPSLVYGLAVGPSEDLALPSAAFLALPPLTALVTGTWLGGWRGALGMVFSVGLVGFIVTPFVLGTPLRGLAGAFVVAVILVVAGCGPVLDRLVARFSRGRAAGKKQAAPGQPGL